VDLGLRGPLAAAPKGGAKGTAPKGVAKATAGAKPGTAAGSIESTAASASRALNSPPIAEDLAGLLDDSRGYVLRVLRSLVEVTGAAGDAERAADAFRSGLEAALRLPGLGQEQLCAGLVDEWTWFALIGRLVSHAIAAVAEPDDADTAIDELQLGAVQASVFVELGLDNGAAWRLVALIRILRHLPLPSSVAGLAAAERAPALVRALIANESIRPYIRVNVWEGVSWFNRESFAQVLWWMLALDALDAVGIAGVGAGAGAAGSAAVAKRLRAAERLTGTLAKAAKAARYQLNKLEAAAGG
jgi:hypothetical protein